MAATPPAAPSQLVRSFVPRLRLPLLFRVALRRLQPRRRVSRGPAAACWSHAARFPEFEPICCFCVSAAAAAAAEESKKAKKFASLEWTSPVDYKTLNPVWNFNISHTFDDV